MIGRFPGSISACQRRSRRRNPGLTTRLAAPEVLLQRFRQDPAPAILGAQLLRTSHQRPEEAGDPPQGRDNRSPPSVVRRHRQPRLTGVVGLATNPVQKKRPAGDRLAVVIGIGQAHEQTPPVLMCSLRKPRSRLRDWHSWSPLRVRTRWPGRTSFPRSDSSRCSALIRFGTPALAGSATPIPHPGGDDVPGGGTLL